jgi:hypothetical protein
MASQAAIAYRAAGKPTRFLERNEDHRRRHAGTDQCHPLRSACHLSQSRRCQRNHQAIVPTQAVINHGAESELCPRIPVKRFKIETKRKIPATLEWVQAFMAHSKQPHTWMRWLCLCS